MSNPENICRLCLKIISTNEFCPLDATFMEKFQLLLPDLKLTPSTNPVICNVCKESLEESHKLKRTCCSSNKLIRFLRNYLGVKHSIELKELIKGNNKKEDKWPRNGHVCRICLKSNEGDYTNINDAKTDYYGSILATCLSTLDENLTTNPVICKFCIDALHNMCNFVKQLTDVENQVKSFCEKVPSEKVNLFEVINFINNREQQQLPSQDEDKTQEMFIVETENKKGSFSQDLDEESPKAESKPNNEEDYDSDSPSIDQDIGPETSTNELPNFNFHAAAVFGSFRQNRIEDWVKRVEEIRAKNNWSESTTKNKVLRKMKTLPHMHPWFSSVADVISWEEFKEKLIYAYPEKDDFYMNIIKITKRKKMYTETFVKYFDAKLELLEPLNLSEKQKVSCLLGGVSHVITNCIGRMGRYQTPKELLTYFKSCDDKEKIKFSEKNDKNTGNAIHQQSESKPLNKNDQIQASYKKLENSNVDHLVQKNLIVVLENKRLDMNNSTNEEKPSEEDKKKPDETNQRCSCCDQKGHSNVNCPLIKASRIPQVALTPRTEKVTSEHTRPNNNLIIVHENRLIVSGSETMMDRNVPDTNQKASETSVVEDVNPTEVKIELLDDQQPPEKPCETSQALKCACCDKPGHSSIDCPLVRGKREVRQTEKSEKRTTSQERGHQMDNAIVIHNTPTKRKEEVFQTKPSQIQKKCSYCDNVGHSSLVCPLIETGGGSPRRSNIKIVLDTDRLNRVKLPSGNVDELGKDDLICENKERSTQKKDVKKCSCCDKIGHMSLNCPLIGLNKNAPGKPIPGKASTSITAPQTPQKCSNCNKFGHSNLNCLVIKVIKNDNEVMDKSLSPWSQTTQKCFSCDKSGHLSVNCPLIEVNKNFMFEQDGDGSETEDDPCQAQSLRKCLCCNKVGHSSLDCPLLGINRSDLLKQSPEKAVRYEPTNIDRSLQVQSTAHSEQKCSCCNKSGHATQNCAFYSFFNKNNSETGGTKYQIPKLLQEAKERLPRTRPAVENVDQPPQKKHRSDSTDQKCYFCGKTNHSSVDCFRARFEQKHSNPQMPTKLAVPIQAERTSVSGDVPKTKAREASPQNRDYQGVLKCEFCGRMGHKLSECFFARFDRKIYESHHNGGSSTSRQCLYCGKFGHLQPDCPKNKPPSKRTARFRSSRPGSSRN